MERRDSTQFASRFATTYTRLLQASVVTLAPSAKFAHSNGLDVHRAFHRNSLQAQATMQQTCGPDCLILRWRESSWLQG